MTREILLIDDDEDELDVFNHALHSIDKEIKCTQVKDLNAALSYVANRSPAYIFIDFHMPVANGLDCITELRKIKRLDGSRIILYSSQVDDDMITKAMQIGAYRCVQKPNMINVLARRLKEILKA